MPAPVPLPSQPAGTPWPTDEWPDGVAPPAVAIDELLDEVFGGGVFGITYAVVLVHGGRLLTERYGGALEHWDRPAEPVGPTTPLLSWSMAK